MISYDNYNFNNNDVVNNNNCVMGICFMLVYIDGVLFLLYSFYFFNYNKDYNIS